MMPIEPRHTLIEHYLGEGDIRHYLPGWEILWETYTPRFVEALHIEQPRHHHHRMGLVIARDTSLANRTQDTGAVTYPERSPLARDVQVPQS
jgi:hypothetical protein